MHFNCHQKLSLTCPYIKRAIFPHRYFSITPVIINCVKLPVFHSVNNGYKTRYASPQTRHWFYRISIPMWYKYERVEHQHHSQTVATFTSSFHRVRRQPPAEYDLDVFPSHQL